MTLPKTWDEWRALKETQEAALPRCEYCGRLIFPQDAMRVNELDMVLHKTCRDSLRDSGLTPEDLLV